MDRRRFLVTAGAAAAATFSRHAWAYEDCGWNNIWGEYCNVGVRSADFRRVSASQRTMVWCWAATLEMIFRWHDVPISQENICYQTYGALIPTTIDPESLMRATKRSYVDDLGRPFEVSSDVYSYFHGVQTLTDENIISELRHENPLVICNQSHMMVLIGASYSSAMGYPQILAGWVADPFPFAMWASDMGPGFRDLPMQDLVPAHRGGALTFLSTVRIS